MTFCEQVTQISFILKTFITIKDICAVENVFYNQDSVYWLMYARQIADSNLLAETYYVNKNKINIKCIWFLSYLFFLFVILYNKKGKKIEKNIFNVCCALVGHISSSDRPHMMIMTVAHPALL